LISLLIDYFSGIRTRLFLRNAYCKFQDNNNMLPWLPLIVDHGGDNLAELLAVQHPTDIKQ